MKMGEPASWWEKILLRFKPVYSIGVDLASGDDYSTKVYIKKLFGRFYITKIWRAK